MKNATFILMSLFLVVSFVVSTPAEACMLCSDCRALNNCYNRCKELFSDARLATPCYSGCIIGCMISAQA